MIAENADVQVLNVVGELDDIAATAEQAEQAAEDNKEEISEEMAGYILKVPFEISAAFLGDHWRLSSGEVKLMAPPAARVFTELFGKYAAQCPDAYMLGFALIAAVGARLPKTINDLEEKKKAVRQKVYEQQNSEDPGEMRGFSDFQG